jgi:hypothetical protein
MSKKRSKSKYPALDPNLNLRSRWDEIADLASYAKTLPPEARGWLNSFAEEEINSNLNHSGIKLNDASDPETRKRIYNKNNARNRCIYTQEVAKGALGYIEEIDLDGEKNLQDEESYD